MSRLRTIKPGFFLDDRLAECQPLARLLFAGLWTIADREGRLEDRPRRIKAETLPYDDCDVDALLDELQCAGFVVRYQSGESSYIAVPTWQEHQQPHYKEALSIIPPPPGSTPDSYKATPVGREQRDRIFERDGYHCRSCSSKTDLSIDHVIPRSMGGDSSDDNLQVLCRKCNSAKNNRMASQSRADVDPTLAGDSQDEPGSSCLVSCLVSCHGSGEEHCPTDEPLDAGADPDDEVIEGELVPVRLQDGPTFRQFWDAYPRREKRIPAERSWNRLTRTKREQAVTVAAHMSDLWAKGLGPERKSLVMLAATFLNQERWDDWDDGPPANWGGDALHQSVSHDTGIDAVFGGPSGY